MKHIDNWIVEFLDYDLAVFASRIQRLKQGKRRDDAVREQALRCYKIVTDYL